MRSTTANKIDCTPCKKKSRVVSAKRQTGLVAGILLALLPKCPFCYMAFSGTLMLCGNGEGMFTRTFSSLPTQFFSITFCLMILLFIILNYRDKRTMYAITLGVIGSSMIIYSTVIAGGLVLYYFGVTIIFFAVWLNASLLYFINAAKKYFADLRKAKLLA